MIQVVLHHAMQRCIARPFRPSRRSRQFLVSHLRHRRAKLRPAFTQVLERTPPFHFAHFPHRRPIHLRRHVLRSSGKPPMHNPVPGSKMIHNFPNRMRATHRMHRSLLSGNPFKQLVQRWPMPCLPRNCSIHLVQYPRNFAHPRTPASKTNRSSPIKVKTPSPNRAKSSPAHHSQAPPPCAPETPLSPPARQTPAAPAQTPHKAPSPIPAAPPE